MEACLTFSSEIDAKHTRIPNPYAGWALGFAVRLDRHRPGLLAASFQFGQQRRQAFFLVLALAEILGIDEVADHLRCAEGMSESSNAVSATVLGDAVLRLRHPRDLVRAVLAGPHVGILGTLARLGDDPIEAPRTYYEFARMHLSRDPVDRRRVKVLGQISGNLVGAQIDIVTTLDPVLLHPALVGCLYELPQVHELHSALTYIRARCSGATDDAIRASLKRLKPGGHRGDLVKFWAMRFDRPPVGIGFLDDPSLLVLNSAAALIDAGKRYRNCLATRVYAVFLGAFVYVEIRSSQGDTSGFVAELRNTNQGFFLEGLYAADNRRVHPESAQIAREKLAACGVALLAHAPGDRESVVAAARLLHEDSLVEPDVAGWGVEALEVVRGHDEHLTEVV